MKYRARGRTKYRTHTGSESAKCVQRKKGKTLGRKEPAANRQLKEEDDVVHRKGIGCKKEEKARAQKESYSKVEQAERLNR